MIYLGSVLADLLQSNRQENQKQHDNLEVQVRLRARCVYPDNQVGSRENKELRML